MSFRSAAKSIWLGGLLTIVAIPSASAASILITKGGELCGTPNNGYCTSVNGATTVDFNDTNLNTGLNYKVPGLVTYEGSGKPFVKGNVSSQYANPPGDDSWYLSVGSPLPQSANPVTLTFAAPLTYFGFYYGSPDTYNSITFYGTNGFTETYDGQKLMSAPTQQAADGSQLTGEFMNFYAKDTLITQIVMSSGSAAFETDNHAFSAVPEPMTMALTGAGLVLAGMLRRFRRS